MIKKQSDIQKYNDTLSANDNDICNTLMKTINSSLDQTESKLWHGHPVWFINGNPIVGYSKQKAGIRLMFWSGADFDEKGLDIRAGKFKDASIFYTTSTDISIPDLERRLEKSKHIQRDYKNIVKRKGVLEKLSIS